MKRIVSLFLSLMMILGAIPLAELKISASPFTGGDGSEGNPYLVSTPEALDAVRNDLNAHYLQIADINMSAWGNWKPIGKYSIFTYDARPFTGSYNGNGFSISNLTIINNEPQTDQYSERHGLFAYTQNAAIKNITLKNIDYHFDKSTTNYTDQAARQYHFGAVVGGICAMADGGVFEGCTIHGRISLKNCASAAVGGIVGSSIYPGTTVINSHNYADITINSNQKYNDDPKKGIAEINCGGIVGLGGMGDITLSSNHGNISAIGDYSVMVGGIAGETSSLIENCVNFGKITAKTTSDDYYGSYYDSKLGNYVTVNSNYWCMAGGIAGYPYYVNFCVNYGDIVANIYGNGWCCIGGIGGRVRTVNGITNSVNHCEKITVIADEATHPDILRAAGRIVGDVNINSVKYKCIVDCYSYSQTMINNSTPTISTDEVNNIHGEGVSKEALEVKSSYPGFDFDTIWEIDTYYDGAVLKNTSAVQPSNDIILFNEYIYRADYLLSECLTDSVIYDILSTNNQSMSKILIDAHPEGMHTAAQAWEVMKKTISSAADGPGDLIRNEIDQHNLIVSYILSAVKYQMEINVAEAVKDNSQDLTNCIGLAADLINAFTAVSQEFSDFAANNKDELSKILLNYYTKIDSPMVKFLKIEKGAKIIEQAIKSAKSFEDLFEKINSYGMLYSATESTKQVLQSMYDICPASDKEIKKALTSVIEVTNAATDELFDDIMTGQIAFTVIAESTSIAADIIWDKITDVIYKKFPAAAILVAIANTGMYAVDKFLGIDATVEQYFKMCTLTQLDALAGKVVHAATEAYRVKHSSVNAEILISAIELKFGFIDQDYKEAIKYSEIIHDEGILREITNTIHSIKGIFTNVQESNKLKDCLLTGEYYKDALHKIIQSAWKNALYNDYPSIADYYVNSSPLNYHKQYSVHCPVNITIYNSDETIGEIGGNTVWSNENIAVVCNHGEKDIYFFDDGNYTLVCNGYAEGDMDISVTDYSPDGNVIRTVNYNNVSISSGSMHTLSGETVTDSEGTTLVADFDSTQGSEKHKVTVNNGVIDGYLTKCEAAPGERIEISAIVPKGYRFVGWLGDVEFEDAKESSTFFFMPDGNVEISAKFKKIDTDDNADEKDDNGSLAVIIIIAAFGSAVVALTVVVLFIIKKKSKKPNKE